MELLFHATHFIYKTTNTVNGKIYIGKRKITNTNADKYYLGSGKWITRAFKKYGRPQFKRDIIEYCDKDFVNDREIYWIAFLDATNPEIGYNISKGGGKDLGILNKGRKKTVEEIEKTRKSNTGKKRTPEQIERCKQGGVGKYIRTPETQAKSSATRSNWWKVNGDTYVYPEEAKEIIRQKATGRIVSQETRQKISNTLSKKYTK